MGSSIASSGATMAIALSPTWPPATTRSTSSSTPRSIKALGSTSLICALSPRSESRMSISQLRDDVQKALADFLWDEWGQMGVAASTKRRDTWATDPEALLLLTFEVGRG